MSGSVFVTGGKGFVGSHLVPELLRQDEHVVLLVRDRHGDDERPERKNWTEVAGDLSSVSALTRILAEYECHTVIHLAAQTQMSTACADPYGTLEANVRGTWTLLEACRRVKPDYVLVASTDKVYGRTPPPYREDSPFTPDRPYETSKACVDLLARTYASTFQIPVGVTRCVNLYGPGHLNFSALVPGTIRRILRGESPVVRNGGKMQRDFMFIEDAVSGYKAMLKAGYVGPVNFSTGSPVEVAEVVRRLVDILGWKGQIRDERDLHGEIAHQWSDSTLARTALGWSPKYELDEGLRLTTHWYAQYFKDQGGKPCATGRLSATTS